MKLHSSFTFEVDSVDEHEDHIGRQSGQEVSHHSLRFILHPVVYPLQALQ